MPIDKVLYAIRMPVDLKAFIDAEAKKRNISSAKFVIDACWSELEEPDDSPFDRPTANGEAYRMTAHIDPSFKAIVNDVPANLAAIRSIPGVFRASDIGTCKQNEARASMPRVAASAPPDTIEVVPQKLCTECDRNMASKIVKGRGIIYACSDMGCPMYGLERK